MEIDAVLQRCPNSIVDNSHQTIFAKLQGCLFSKIGRLTAIVGWFAKATCVKSTFTVKSVIALLPK